MAELKLTKTELRDQQTRLNQLSRYLPTLQLKKALLQTEVGIARHHLQVLRQNEKKKDEAIASYSALFTQDIITLIQKSIVRDVYEKTHENIAGADIPKLERLQFSIAPYDLFDTPAWFEVALSDIIELMTLKISRKIAEERARILEHELREVSIRVNLFEKVLIPRCRNNIKKIKIFLGDLQLAAVSQAKVAKAKILERKEAHLSEAHL